VKISFDKITHTPKPFSLDAKDLRLEGILERKSQHNVELKAQMSGKIELICDRCGTSYYQETDEALTLHLRDEISQDKDDLDIIEFLDGVIDVTYILESEANSFANDYHFCTKCAEDDGIMEIEF
jgi:uncharacterized metal-binding protein YceD (DUF177 family)